MDGATQRIYKHKDYYKNIGSFTSLIVDRKYKQEKEIKAHFYKSQDISCDSEKQQDVILVLQYSIGKIINKPVYRYIPISTRWNWGYWRSRYQIKSIIYILEKLKICSNGYELEPSLMSELVEGMVFPETIKNSMIKGITWYAEDYIDLASDSFVAKELHETPKVREYMNEQGYIKHLNSEISKIENILVMPNLEKFGRRA